MNMLMCRVCGNFVMAVKDEEELLPMQDECPQCGGTEFKDNESGRIIEKTDN